ncbi:E3 ubiquitin/ISG15 ligase TRIM25-like isoform X3, partial [Tachysurus ichikawai]
MEQLSHTHNDIHFLQSFPSLCVSPGCDDSPSFTVNQHLSFDGMRESLSDLKKRVKQIFEEEFNKIQPQGTLSFYSVSDTMRLLHRVHTTFTQPLYAGFYLFSFNSPTKLCDPK